MRGGGVQWRRQLAAHAACPAASPLPVSLPSPDRAAGNYAVSGGIAGCEAVEKLAKGFKARWGAGGDWGWRSIGGWAGRLGRTGRSSLLHPSHQLLP